MAFELSQLEEQVVAALKAERKDMKMFRYSLRSSQRTILNNLKLLPDIFAC
jgi:hypothetical protein